MTRFFHDPKAATRVRTIMRFVLITLVGCIRLDLHAKDSCTVDTDCVVKGESCVAQKCQVPPPVVPCQTHFDCDANHVCVDSVCTTFTPITLDQLWPAIGAAVCARVLDLCGESVMQNYFGTDYESGCLSSQARQPGDTFGYGPEPVNPGDFDAKMAAACVVDSAKIFDSVHLSSFGEQPPTCDRVLTHGTLDAETYCYAEQSYCKPGMECAYGLSFTDGQWEFDICIPRLGQQGDVCVESTGFIDRDCDSSLYCDWSGTRLCQPRIPAHGACTKYDPCVQSDGSGQVSCYNYIDPCVDGSVCSATTSQCEPTPATCPIGATR